MNCKLRNQRQVLVLLNKNEGKQWVDKKTFQDQKKRKVSSREKKFNREKNEILFDLIYL